MDEITATYNRIAAAAEAIERDAQDLASSDVSALSAEALADIADTALSAADALSDFSHKLNELERERL